MSNQFEELYNKVKFIVDKKKDVNQKQNLNIFKLLEVENAEDKTHSALLGNLLNPLGSHNKGTFFLNLFLQEIKQIDFISDYHTPYLILEHSIGKVDLKNKTGGRIDIYLNNGNGKTICIENKINAGLQPYQLQRYLNYNKENNYVVFLNPTMDINIDYCIESEIDKERFVHITYEREIINWLKKSKEHLEQDDYLRVILEQYLDTLYVITKKEKDMGNLKELKTHILDHISEAKEIADNYTSILNDIRIKFQEEVHFELQGKISSPLWNVELGNTADKTNAQIWIKPKGMLGLPLCFGMETFSNRGFFTEGFVIGVFSAVSVENIIIDGRKKGYWLDYINVSLDGKNINFNNDSFIAELEQNKEIRLKVKNEIINNFLAYFEDYKEVILDWHNSTK